MNNLAGYIGALVAQLDGPGSDPSKPCRERLDRLLQSLGVTS
jgi:hypothetical protein